MQDRVNRLIHYYFGEDPKYSVESVPFGLTNLTKIININERKYVIRIYNQFTKSMCLYLSGQAEETITYDIQMEHKVLWYLFLKVMLPI
jgi:hypothetical protein